VAAVRSALLLAYDPADHIRRVLAQFKSSYSELGPSLDFELVEGENGWAKVEPGIERPEFYRGEGLLLTSEESGGRTARPRTDPLKEAAHLARELLLTRGPMKAEEVREQLREAGHEPPTEGSALMRFRRMAGYEFTRVSEREGGRYTLWYIPDKEPERESKPVVSF
jgi:hypothetical protein